MKRIPLAAIALSVAACGAQADDTDVRTTAPTTTTTEAVSTTTTSTSTTTSTTPQVAAPMPQAQARAAGVEQWRALVSQYPWPVEEALRIMECESRGDPSAWSSTSDAGLYQIHMPLWADTFAEVTGTTDGFDPVANVAFAYWLWSQSHSFKHWTCASHD